MNDFNSQFKNSALHTRLTHEERSRIRATFTAPEPSPFFIQSPYVFRFAYAFAALLLVVGGTAYAAEGALPGDLLYPVKVSVNEPAEGAFAFSTKAQAEWHAKIAETRLTEAETLASQGRLTASTTEELALSFKEHADSVVALTPGAANAAAPQPEEARMEKSADAALAPQAAIMMQTTAFVEAPAPEEEVSTTTEAVREFSRALHAREHTEQIEATTTSRRENNKEKGKQAEFTHFP